MSGGSFGHEEYKISYIADEINEVIEKGEYSNEINEKLKEAVRVLKIAKIYAHRVDYLFSGDDSEESFLRRLEYELSNYEA